MKTKMLSFLVLVFVLIVSVPAYNNLPFYYDEVFTNCNFNEDYSQFEPEYAPVNCPIFDKCNLNYNQQTMKLESVYCDDNNYEIRTYCNSDFREEREIMSGGKKILKEIRYDENWRKLSETTEIPEFNLAFSTRFEYSGNSVKIISPGRIIEDYYDGEVLSRKIKNYDGSQEYAKIDIYQSGDYSSLPKNYETEDYLISFNSYDSNDYPQENILHEKSDDDNVNSKILQKYGDDGRLLSTCFSTCNGFMCASEGCSVFAYGSPIHNITGDIYSKDLIYEYDKSGNLIYDPILNITYEYDEQNRIISDGVYRYEYNEQGKISKQLDFYSNETITGFNYNLLGYISEVVYSYDLRFQIFRDINGNPLIANMFGEILIYPVPGSLDSAVTLEQLNYMIKNPIPESEITLKDVLFTIQKWLDGEENFVRVINKLYQWRQYRASLR